MLHFFKTWSVTERDKDCVRPLNINDQNNNHGAKLDYGETEFDNTPILNEVQIPMGGKYYLFPNPKNNIFIPHKTITIFKRKGATFVSINGCGKP